MSAFIRLKGKGLVALLLAAVLFVLAAIPVSSAESGTSLEVRVKVGSNQMKINGAAVKVQPPFKSAGNVMVPLSVFTNTKGFGAKVQLKNNKIITLTYEKHIVVLTLGSKSATIDGKKVTLAAAPVNKQGVTMVPLTILVKTFGAKQAIDAKTKEIVIKATVASDSTGSQSGIDTDSGKSQIGDSHYKWSMNYPTGLVQDVQFTNGEWISFSDVKGDYYMAISIMEAEDPLDVEDKRDLIKENMEDDETIVDVKTITRSGGSFERIVTKQYDFFYEYRGIQANGYFYTVVFGKQAKSASELNQHAGLLDSFQPKYDSSNKSLKDLARIINGKVVFENKDYGLKIHLPKEWSEDTEDTNPYFYGPDSTSLMFQVNSIKPGDTLEDLIKRKLQFYKDQIVQTYQKDPITTAITWNGIPATLVEYSYTYDKETWWSEYEVYAIKGNNKYYLNYTFEDKDKDTDEVKGVLEEILHGMKVDFSVIEKSFGEIPDPNDTADYQALVTKTSKTDEFSITVPKYWTKGLTDMESGSILFSGYGLDIYIGIDPESSLSELQESMETGFEIREYKVDSKTNVTFAGVNATKYEISSTYSNMRITSYLFENKGKVYLIQGSMNDFSGTEMNRNHFNAAINSFQFTSK
ncbi:stalk domain-containing protein [Cohnella luojiensis]|uniref:Copper amine oxidase-like N-terminal domain-containing protein n=1 Tax=Cohnella luojiensis TaxID=652876 RepID=A0A4Y8M397_9BACL|nr:stalk domain-containing protein [Cohnella luojiensis]TFE29075.1 hypothetical protein E2980_06730 [Cohnella luojiensis]